MVDENDEWHHSGFTQCEACKLIYRDPMPTEERLRGFYESDYRKPDYPTLHDRRIQLTRAERILHYMETRVGIAYVANMLDFGCANAVLLEEARMKWGCQVFGVEMNPVDRRIAKEQRGIEVSSTIDDAGNCYDMVVLAHVLEHLPDPLGFMVSLTKRVLPGGYVIFEMPNHTASGAWGEAHVTVWFLGVFKTLLTLSGWEHVDTTYVTGNTIFHAAGRRP
jgi:2-polyprenyl-3-methyl-5-hydroxy-6-metoxy-1,4-benzoquinol methylase